MGISAGPDHTDLNGQTFHLEAKDQGVALWTGNEKIKLLMLSPDQARALAEDLQLHARLIDGQ